MLDALQSLEEVLDGADAALRRGAPAGARVWSTGFPILDGYLSGGLRSGELTLLGGPQGLGKTALALQMLRNAVVRGETGVYFSYEHDATTVLERLVALEAGLAMDWEAVPLRRIRAAVEAKDGRSGSLEARLAVLPGAAEAVQAVRAYASRLLVHRSSGSATGLGTIAEVVEAAHARSGVRPLVVVDYLQKVAAPQGSAVEDERATLVVEGLKDLALVLEVPVLAIVAAEKEGLVAGRRLRVHHLRGTSALAYEADVVLLLNDKYEVVARQHLMFGNGSADRFREYVVLSLEKNRSGLDKIDLQLRKRFDQARFDTEMELVPEQLIDERVQPD